MDTQGNLISPRDKAFQNLVRSISFRIDIPNSLGSGFFIGETLAVTARHVLGRLTPGSNINGLLEGTPIAFKVSSLFWDEFAEHDLALLEPIDCVATTCAFLDAEARIQDECWICGYSRNQPGGDAVHVFVESSENTKIKISHGQVDFGFSGSPAVNLRTGGVVGVTVSSRGPQNDLGGFLISSAILLNIDSIRNDNISLVKDDGQWIKYCPSPIETFKSERRLSSRPINYVRRERVQEDLVALACDRFDQKLATALVIFAPSGYGKTNFADDLMDRLETKLNCNGIRVRCYGQSPLSPPKGSPILCDGLNDIDWSPQELRRWLEGLDSPRIITTSDASQLPILRMALSIKSDPGSFNLVKLDELSFEEALQLVERADLPCEFDNTVLAKALYTISLGSPFLMQMALDLACCGELELLPEDLRRPESEAHARNELFSAWRSSWLLQHSACDSVANTLCLASNIGLSDAALFYIFSGSSVDVQSALDILEGKGLISRAGILDKTFIPHGLLRQTYHEANLSLTSDGSKILHDKLLEYATSVIADNERPIRDPLTIIDTWMHVLHGRFEGAYENSQDEIPPFIQFSKDMIGELAARARGIGSEEWKNWLSTYFRKSVTNMDCSHKIALSQAIVRVVPDAQLGDAFCYGWQIGKRTDPQQIQDAAGESYCMLASAICWAGGDSGLIESAKYQFKEEWRTRRYSTDEENFSHTHRLAFLCAFAELGDAGMLEVVMHSSPRDELPDMIASLILKWLAKGDKEKIDELISRYRHLINSIHPAALIFLLANKLPGYPPNERVLEFNPNWAAYMAFASGNDAFRDIVYLLVNSADNFDGRTMTINREIAMQIIEISLRP